MGLIYCDVYNGAGTTKLGDGPVDKLTSVSISDTMDALRTFTLSMAALDYRGFRLLVPGRQVKVYMKLDTGSKLVAEGFIEEYAVNDKLSGVSVKLKCRDIARELQYYSTLYGRSYTDTAISTIVNDLIGLASGWTATIDAGLGNATIKFDGISVLKALQDLAKATGLHFRRGTGKTIEFGALGDEIDLRLIQPAQLAYEIYFNDDVAFVTDIATGYDEAEVINWISPLGNKDDGVNRVTLEHATLSSPYTVQSAVGPDGDTYYYITDATSVSSFGTRQVFKVFNNIKIVMADPVAGPTATEQEAASNQLYTQAVSALGRRIAAETRYTVNVVKAWERIPAIGQKLLLVYRGEARQFGTPNYFYIDVNELLWVTKQTITVDDTGLKIKFEVSNRDIPDESDVVNVLVDTVIDYNQQKV